VLNPINWFEKLENGVKREVQVTVARQRVVWAFRILGEDAWEDKTQPTAGHWDDLLQKMKDRHQRRRATELDMGLVTRLHKQACDRVRTRAGLPRPDPSR
jgi:hypothetical protein